MIVDFKIRITADMRVVINKENKKMYLLIWTTKLYLRHQYFY